MVHQTVPSGNVLGGLQSVLAGFGVAEVAKRDEITVFVEDFLAEAGLVARVKQLRHKRLILEADAQVAVFLRYRLEGMRVALAEGFPGAVEEVSVVVRT